MSIIKSWKLEFDLKQTIAKRGLGVGERVQKVIDSEVMRRVDPYTPKREGILISSIKDHTQIGSGKVGQKTPYARRLYYNKSYNFSGAPKRGAFWFERMKADQKTDILKTASDNAGAKASK